jgi:hypothetical protein
MVNKPSKAQIGWALVVAAALLATLFFGVNYPIPEPPAEPVIESRAAGNVEIMPALRVLNYIENQGTLTQTGNATLAGDLAVAGAMAVTGGSNYTGNVSFGGDATVTDDLAVGSSLATAKQLNITVTMNSPITVTGSFTGLTAAGSVATAAISGCEANGHLTMFANMGSNTITITDTGNLKLSANWAAGQFDTLTTLGDGSNCIEIARANN